MTTFNLQLTLKERDDLEDLLRFALGLGYTEMRHTEEENDRHYKLLEKVKDLVRKNPRRNPNGQEGQS